MRGGTLFSGIGAPECAAPDIDWRWAAEIDPFASAVHKARFPHIPNLGDVNEIDPAAIEPVDLIVFGSPCQSFSVAGQRGGLDDDRGDMALVGLRLVGRIRPRWVVFENVPGLLSSNGGRDFGAILGTLGQCGYGFAYRILDAQHTGVPQRRRRVFVVGCLGDWRGAAAVLFERSCLRRDTAPGRETGEDVAACLRSGSESERGHRKQNGTDRGTLIAGTLGAGDGARGWRNDLDNDTYVAWDITGTGPGVRNGARETNIHTALRACKPPGQSEGDDTTVIAAFSAKDDGGDAGDTSPTLRAGMHHGSHANAGVMPAIAFGGGNPAEIDIATACNASERWDFESETFVAQAFYSTESRCDNIPPPIPILEIGKRTNGDGYRDGDGIGHQGDPMYSPQAGDPMFTLDRDSRHGVRQAMSVRRLTPRECEKLQGLPPGWTDVTYRGKPAADGPRYRAIGNSMAVPCVGWVLGGVVAVNGPTEAAA